MLDVIVVGGGISGLVNSILLARSGFSVLLIEKKSYPFHRVCGEYISNEVVPFLENHNLFPSAFEPAGIEELEVSSVKGRRFLQTLDLGGFGISRYTYDHWLSQQAKASGVQLLENTTASEVRFSNNQFTVVTSSAQEFQSRLVIGSHGKRSKLDASLNRGFLKEKSPYVGVKYHLRANLPQNRISLHNFEGGYGGLSMVEDGKFNFCYMTHRDQVRKSGSLESFEQNILRKNPHLDRLYGGSKFLFEKPEVINEITFSKQEPVWNHMLMSGDAAGMITPLCGNGMAMAIHSAKILCDLIKSSLNKKEFDRTHLERQYTEQWSKQFAMRLWSGRKIQTLFGQGVASGFGVFIGKYVKPVSRFLISQTHGAPFS